MQEKGQLHLAEKLPKSIGWSMGTELRESHYQLNAKNGALIKPNMIFNLTLGAPSNPAKLCMIA